ncbi:MAG: thiol:disulfide interchange protein DsbA/DsbL [Sedimenticolaceae bacterium]
MFRRLTAIFVALLVLAGGALAETFEEGKQYVLIQPQAPVGVGNDVEVIEFFWYGCPHCRDFEPTIAKWASGLPENVTFTQVPVMFGGPADLHAQAYYALQGMGELARLHEKLFHAMHVEKNKLRSREELDAFLESNDVDMAQFREAMNSFAVAAKVNRARALMRRYGIRGVPALVVDGRYRSGSGFKSYQEMTEVADYLVDKVLMQRNAQANR